MLASLATPVLPLWSRWSRPPRGAAAIREAQNRILARLVSRLAPLPVGARFGLDALRGRDLVGAFRAQVAVTQYADYAALIDRVVDGAADVLFPGRAEALAQTSGTTRDASAGERWIPQGSALLAHHRRGGSAALARLLGAAGPSLLSGRSLMLGGTTTLDRRRAVPAGDLSGICAARLPAWLRSRRDPDAETMAVTDLRLRLERTARSTARRDVRLAAGIPSWLLVLFDLVCREASAARVGDAWSRFSGLIHGGHAIEPFLATLSRHLDGGTWMMEVYPASEAFIAIGERPWRLGEAQPPPLELLTAHGCYLEFLPDDAADDWQSVVGAEALDDGRLYRVLVTTPGGLIRYQVGDLVRGLGPGLVRFAGRTKARMSVFGEHVEGDALAAAIGAACSACAAEARAYHVAPVFPTASDPRGRHEWWIEFARPPADPQAFIAAIDRHLADQVLDYRAHRADDQQLVAPTLRTVPTGTFDAWLAASGKLDVQRKIPQTWPDRAIADQLEVLVAASHPHSGART